MKKTFLSLSLLTVAAASQAVVVYNTTTSLITPTYSTSTGNLLAGDNFNLPSAGAGKHWQITGLSWIAYANAAGLSTQTLQIGVFNGVGVQTAPNPVFSNAAATINTSINATAAGAGSGFIFSLSNLKIDLAATPTVPASGYGISFKYGANTSGANYFSPGYTNSGSVVAGSAWSNGYYRDADNNGVLASNDFRNFTGWTAGNVAMSITAQAVPEPGTMVALGLGAVAMLRRRKKA